MNPQLKGIITLLAEWREARNLSMEHQRENFIKNTQEECEELANATNNQDYLDAVCDLIIVALNSFEIDLDKLPNTEERFFATKHILQEADVIFNCDVRPENYIAMLLNMIAVAKYDPILCLYETIKEISSRRQDFQQMLEWEKLKKIGKKPTDKWLKDKHQTDTYKADYSKCHRGAIQYTEGWDYASSVYRELEEKGFKC